MYKVKFYQSALNDYHSIGSYIAEDNLFYAQEVLNKIDHSIDTIAEYPFLGKEIESGIYRIIEPRYRFKIVYKITDNIIYIVSIFKYKNIWE